MQEPNESTQKPSLSQEICSIRIVFPVESDDQAIDFKKKIRDILSEIPDAAIQFTLMSKPTGSPAHVGLG